MSRDEKLDRVRVVSSRPVVNQPRRRRSDLDAPIIEIAGEKEEKDSVFGFAGGTAVWGISRPLLLTFLAGCGLGGVLAAIIGSL